MINTDASKCLQFVHINIKIINVNYNMVNVTLYIFLLYICI